MTDIVQRLRDENAKTFDDGYPILLEAAAVIEEYRRRDFVLGIEPWADLKRAVDDADLEDGKEGVCDDS